MDIDLPVALTDIMQMSNAAMLWVKKKLNHAVGKKLNHAKCQAED